MEISQLANFIQKKGPFYLCNVKNKNLVEEINEYFIKMLVMGLGI